MIGVINYGVGNLGSVLNAFKVLDIPATIVETKEELLACDKLVLPGVGAFGDAIATFLNHGLKEPLDQFIKSNRPVLGICVGMQMLFEGSEEYGFHSGLGYFKGVIEKMPSQVGKKRYKIPHMGWNKLSFQQDCPLFKGLDSTYVYFVHSYGLMKMSNEVVAQTTYSCPIGVAVQKGNLYAVQFHPEKSGTVGLQILKNFGEL